MSFRIDPDPGKEWFGVGVVANGQKKTMYVYGPFTSGFMNQPGSRDPGIISQDLLCLMLPQHLDVGSCQDTFLHYFGGPENITSDDHVHFPAQAGQMASSQLYLPPTTATSLPR